MILGGPKDTITSIWTKSLKALVPPKSLGPPPMGGVGVDFKDRVPVSLFGQNMPPGPLSMQEKKIYCTS